MMEEFMRNTHSIDETKADDKWKFNEKMQHDEDEESDEIVTVAPPKSSAGAVLSGNYLNTMVSSWVTKLNLNEDTISPMVDKQIGVLKMNEPSICHKLISYKTTIEEKSNQYENMAGLKALNPT